MDLAFSTFILKFPTMKRVAYSVLLICTALVLSSWAGGPAKECSKDSFAIVRIVQPMSDLFDIRPVMYISKGEGKIEQVEMTDAEVADGHQLLKQTITEFLINGYTIQTATETVDDGLKLNTYYLKKKVI